MAIEVHLSNGEYPVQIRTVTTADIPHLADVQLCSALSGFAHIFPDSIPKPSLGDLEEEWAVLVADRDTVVLAATIAETVVGVLAFGPDTAGQDKETDCILLKLYVAPNHFGKGIGSILHDRAIGSLRKESYQRARLWVLEHNTRARQMYERRGWTHRPWSRSDWPDSGIDEVGYTLDLV